MLSGIMQVRNAVAMLLGLLLVCAPRAAGGQGPNPGDDNPLKKLSLEQLGNVEVTTASKEPEQVWNTPAAIFVLTSEDIRRSGVTTIPDALRLVPGVEVSRNDAIGYSVGIRGFETVFSKGLLVMIDGRSLYTTLFGGVYSDLPDYPLEDIDRIEVVRGPGGTIWGANAVNGVINIITKNSKDTQGWLVSAGSGTVDQWRNTVRYGGAHGKMTYRLYEESFSIGPEFHFVPGTVTNFDDWWTVRGGFRTDWTPNSRDKITFQGDMFASREGEQTAIAGINPPAELNPIFRDRVSGGNLLLRWSHTFSETSDFQLQTYYNKVDRDRPQFGETLDTYDVDLIYHIAPGLRQDFILGTGFRIIPDHIGSHHPGSVDFFPADRTDKLYSGFLQDTVQLVPDKLSLTAGVKLEHNSYSGFEFQPTGRLLYRPRKEQTFWAAVTRAVQTPSRLDQDINIAAFAGGSTFLRLIGQKSYDAEPGVNYEGGYRQLFGNALYFDLAVFHNSYHGLENVGSPALVLAATPPPPHVDFDLFFLNGAAGTTDGVEVAPNWKVSSRMQLAGSYSYLTMDFRSTVGAIGQSVVRNLNHEGPHHRVVVMPRIDLPGNLEFDPTYRYEAAIAADFSHPVQAYHTLDMRLGWHPQKQFEISVVGQNLLQPHHVETSSSNPLVGIRRGVFAKLTWRQ